MTDFFITGRIGAKATNRWRYYVGGKIRAKVKMTADWGYPTISGRIRPRTRMRGYLTAKHDPTVLAIGNPELLTPYANSLEGTIRPRVKMSGLSAQYYIGRRTAQYGYVEHVNEGLIKSRTRVKGYVGRPKDTFNLTHRTGDGELQYNYYRQQEMGEDLDAMRGRAAEAGALLGPMLLIPGFFEGAIALARGLCALIPPPICIPIPAIGFDMNFGFLCEDSLFNVGGQLTMDLAGNDYLHRHLSRGKLLSMIDRYYSALFESGFMEGFRLAYQLLGELRRLCHSDGARKCLINVSLSVSADSVVEAANGNWTGFIDANINVPNVLGGALCDLFATLDARMGALLDALNCAEMKFDAWRRFLNGEGCPESRLAMTLLFS